LRHFQELVTETKKFEYLRSDKREDDCLLDVETAGDEPAVPGYDRTTTESLRYELRFHEPIKDQTASPTPSSV